MRLCIILVAAMISAAASPDALTAQQQPPAAGDVEFVRPNPNAPFSQLVRVGNTIYLSGMLGTVPGQGVVPGGIQPETRQTLENIRTALDGVGATMDDVVKCTVFLADFAEWAAMNQVYVTFFPNNRPARSAVAVAGMAANARVEIECIAELGAAAAARGGGTPQ